MSIFDAAPFVRAGSGTSFLNQLINATVLYKKRTWSYLCWHEAFQCGCFCSIKPRLQSAAWWKPPRHVRTKCRWTALNCTHVAARLRAQSGCSQSVIIIIIIIIIHLSIHPSIHPSTYLCIHCPSSIKSLLSSLSRLGKANGRLKMAGQRFGKVQHKLKGLWKQGADFSMGWTGQAHSMENAAYNVPTDRFQL